MQNIKKDELYRNLGDFLKSKGIELKDGSYTTRIQHGCNLLSDAINATQKTVKDTKVQVDETLDKLRESIHRHTAPRSPSAPKAGGSAGSSKSPHAKRKNPPAQAKHPAGAARARRQK